MWGLGLGTSFHSGPEKNNDSGSSCSDSGDDDCSSSSSYESATETEPDEPDVLWLNGTRCVVIMHAY